MTTTVQEEFALRQVQRAILGGDYRACFQGKELWFKSDSLRDSGNNVSETLQDLGKEIEVPHVTMPSVSIPLPGLPQIDLPDLPSLPTLELGIIDKIREIAAAITNALRAVGALAKAAFNHVKRLFKQLVSLFSPLKAALLEAFKVLMEMLQASFDVMIDLLCDLLPDVFIQFISGIIAAIVPFLGQIKAVGKMLVQIGKSVKAEFDRRNLRRAATHLANNKFTRAARNTCERLISEEIAKVHATTAMETANCAVSLTGLVFTGNIAGMVSGIATAIAKLCLQIGSLVLELITIKKGNEELDYLKSHPDDLHPARLFDAAPILGAHYIAVASTSSILSFQKVGGVRGFFGGGSLSQMQIQQEARALSPFKLKAMKLVSNSRLDLVTPGQRIQTAVTAIKDEAKDRVQGAIKDQLTA